MKKCAIIGCGKIGFIQDSCKPSFNSTHVSAIVNNKGAELVAVCDIDIAKTRSVAKKFKVKVFSDIREMMKATNPEIVSICTPDETHYSVLMEVIKYNSVKGVWCEKPLAITLSQGARMIERCRKKNIKLLVNHVRRYDPFYISIKKNMHKLLGKVQSVVCYYSGGIVTTGSHVIDLLNFLFGRCINVTAHRKSETDFHSVLTYVHNGAEIRVNLIPLDTKHFSALEMNIMGSKARLDTVNKPFGYYDYRYFSVEKDKKIGAKYICTNKATPLKRGMKREFLDNALKDLIATIKNNRKPASSGEEALKSLEIISSIVHSANLWGKTISLPANIQNIRIPKAGGDVGKWKK